MAREESGAASIVAPKGLFRRDRQGCSTLAVQVPIERGKIQFFSQTLGEVSSVHLDVGAARAAGYPDILAPATFFMVVEALANDQLRRTGHETTFEFFGCDFRYLLHGSESYEYVNPIFAGEEVSFAMTAVDFYEKKNGLLEFITLEGRIESAERGLLIRATRTLLHRFG